MIQYRTGIDAETGQLLTGLAHVSQSVSTIITTVPLEMVMLLDFGCDVVSRIGRNMYRESVLRLYGDIVTAVHRWEPEYRISRMQLVNITRTGGLAIALPGTYYPEGRFGNYALAEPVTDLNINLIKATA